MRFCSYRIFFAALLPLAAITVLRAETVTPRIVYVVRTDIRTGRLVRSVVVTPKTVSSRVVAGENTAAAEMELALIPALNSGVKVLVEATARAYDISPALVDSVIQVESNYNPNAISRKGAQGLMQLMPQTARRFGVKNTFDPKENIEGGVRYLKFLQDTFKDDRLAIAAYNAGEGAVSKYGNVPPYKETMDYVVRVGKKIGQSKRSADAIKKTQAAAVTDVVAASEKPPEDQHRSLTQYIDEEGRVHIATR